MSPVSGPPLHYLHCCQWRCATISSRQYWPGQPTQMPRGAVVLILVAWRTEPLFLLLLLLPQLLQLLRFSLSLLSPSLSSPSLADCSRTQIDNFHVRHLTVRSTALHSLVPFVVLGHFLGGEHFFAIVTQQRWVGHFQTTSYKRTVKMTLPQSVSLSVVSRRTQVTRLCYEPRRLRVVLSIDIAAGRDRRQTDD